MISTNDTRSTLNKLNLLIKAEKRLFYTRFGDGDFYVMIGENDGYHKYSPELAEELEEAFKIEHPNFIKAMIYDRYPIEDGMVGGKEGWFRPEGLDLIDYDRTEKALKLIGVENGFYESHSFIPYLTTFEPELIIDFMDENIKPKKKMLINCWDSKEEMAYLEQFLGRIDYFVKVPNNDSYYKMDEWFPKVLENIDDVDLCIPTAGLASRVVQKRLFKMGKEIQSIDLGAIIDVVCGKETRRWMKKTTSSILRKNLKLG